MSVPLVHPGRIDWAGLAARARPPVVDPGSRVVVSAHITVIADCDPDTCTCGGVRTVRCTCGHLCTDVDPRRCVGRRPHALTHPPWRGHPAPAWSTRPHAHQWNLP